MKEVAHQYQLSREGKNKVLAMLNIHQDQECLRGVRIIIKGLERFRSFIKNKIFERIYSLYIIFIYIFIYNLIYTLKEG